MRFEEIVTTKIINFIKRMRERRGYMFKFIPYCNKADREKAKCHTHL